MRTSYILLFHSLVDGHRAVSPFCWYKLCCCAYLCPGFPVNTCFHFLWAPTWEAMLGPAEFPCVSFCIRCFHYTEPVVPKLLCIPDPFESVPLTNPEVHATLPASSQPNSSLVLTSPIPSSFPSSPAVGLSDPLFFLVCPLLCHLVSLELVQGPLCGRADG